MKRCDHTALCVLRVTRWSDVKEWLSGFVGLDVACWPLLPKFRGGGFKPDRSRRIFSAEKILGTPSFGGE
jgi:hypothetical protein